MKEENKNDEDFKKINEEIERLLIETNGDFLEEKEEAKVGIFGWIILIILLVIISMKILLIILSIIKLNIITYLVLIH